MNPLLFQQPDCKEQEIYSRVPQKAADSFMHTVGLGTDRDYQEQGKRKWLTGGRRHYEKGAFFNP